MSGEPQNIRKIRTVCHLSTAHPASDDRIFYKECCSLAANGYNVFYVAPHDRDEVIDGVSILALPKTRSRTRRMLLNGWLAFRKGMKTGARVIHFHDPELIPAGLLFKLFGRKVIYDVHELVFHHLDHKPWLGPFTRRMMRSAYRFFEWFAIRSFDRIILVVDDDLFRDYFFKSYPKQQQKFLFIRNYCMVSFMDAQPRAEIPSGGRKVLIYAGGLSRERGIREVIRATAMLEEQPMLVLFGQWSDGYREECMDEPGWKNVTEMGFRKLEEVYPYIKAADLGIAILYPLKNYMTSLPVKVFEYMACSKPVLMSDFPFWIKNFSDCAWFVDPQRPEKIAEVLKEILSNDREREKRGTNGRELAIRKYSWESEEKSLLACYDELFKK